MELLLLGDLIGFFLAGIFNPLIKMPNYSSFGKAMISISPKFF